MRPRLALARAIRAEQRRKRLRDDQLPGEVDLDLLAELVELQIEQEARHRDPGVVDEADQRFATQRRRNLFRAPGNGRLVGHIEQDGHEIGPEFLGQPLPSAGLRHAAEDAETLGNKNLADPPADTGG